MIANSAKIRTLIVTPAIRAILYARGPGLNPALGATARALWAYAILFAIGWYWT